MATKSITIELDGKSIILETGLFGAQADGAVTARCGDTLVFSSVVAGPPQEGIDYFPLTVDYREKHYAGGVISSSRFIKRETRPSDDEVLTCRLIDRSIRPLFPSGLYDQVQVIAHPFSFDGENDPTILSLIATSAALMISDIPFNGPLGAVRVGVLGDKFITNPTVSERKDCSLDILVSGTTGSIAMVEAGGLEVSEGKILEAMKFAQDQIKIVNEGIMKLADGLGKPKRTVLPEEFADDLLAMVEKHVDIKELLKDSKTVGGEGASIDPILDQILLENPEADRVKLSRIIDYKMKDYVRELVLVKGIRFDGRKPDEIRTIASQVALLPRTHGSAFFQRGMTHVLSVATLGSPSYEQLIDGMAGEETKRYFHHYNMPPYATGAPGRYGAAGRREIGHGALAEKALLPVLPSEVEFPYVIRVVSEVMSSNGSTSQASVCGSTLALMDAGVPITKAVAGIAMGLMTDGKSKYVTLSDIAGLEDHVGDMDFKVAGTVDGVTAIQMDVKVPGVTAQVLGEALDQAKVARLFILEKMMTTLDKPRESISQYAPKIVSVTIDPEKIGEVIGPGGKMIRKIQTDFAVTIDVDDTGIISITGTNHDGVTKAKEFIKGLTAEVEVGKTYEGVVDRVETYGAFVEILPGKSGLIHVSRLGKGFVNSASDVLSVGDKVTVHADEVDDRGRINISLIAGGRTPPPSTQGRPPARQQFRDQR